SLCRLLQFTDFHPPVRLSYAEFARPLLVGFPIGSFKADLWIVCGGLGGASAIDRAGYNRMFTRAGLLPIEGEEGPGVPGGGRASQRRRRARTVVDWGCE